MCFVALGLNDSKMRDRVSLWQTWLTIFGICRLKFVKKKRRQYLINLSYILNYMYKYCVALLSSGVP